MKKLQPFGDVPKKLTEQLRRSFVASRTFAQALLEGKQIVNKISKVCFHVKT
jgi:glypican 4 (K-glypican)